ncbi:MAG: zinc ribbon domain-containing protein [Thermoleophilia bacterium]|nr:zinc ribbon domain-containing protein [Thermoleophilia bacterium]
MPLAIFGIENTAINLVVTFAILCVVAIYLATIVYTFTDARRRIADPFLVGCSTAASLFPFVGTLVYTILRPPEFLEDIHERETEVRVAEVRLRHLEAHSCQKCGFPTESDFVRCPSCRTRLKNDCPTCSKPVGLDWKLCPYCETQLVAPKRSSRSGSSKSSSKPSSKSKDPDRAEPKRSRRSSKPQSDPATPESSGRSSSRKSSRSPSSERESSRREKPTSSSTSSGSSEETVESAAARPSPDSDATRSDRSERSSRRTPRSARRKTITPDEDPNASKPINSGDSPAPSRTPESR